MKATEFVKKFGLDKAKKLCVTQAPVSADYYNVTGGYVRKVNKKGWIPSENCVCISEVKQIVEAFELVESYGGLAEARWDLDDPNIDASEAFDLKQAINLVEQCNA